MTDAEIAAIRAREAAATRGPWEAVYDGDWQVEEEWDYDGMINPPQIAYQARCYHANTPNNMRFLAYAREDIPALLAERDTLVAENAQLRAGIAGLRREHKDVCRWCDEMEPCPSNGVCECGADEHNARIDALLTPDPPRLP